ncbi:TadE/TadG family type IV pilus assembly protein [Arthrobacter sp. 2YAF22_2]|uniref:TadE/TadG family type IV pilus assembly protein n=1 Tax=Arthrobacter sp. 2YAF22_2 TaxID=3233029 RepID=UPI003F8DA70A
MEHPVKPCDKRKSKELGAVAVEFALILPIFLALILGIVEYGRAFGIQVSMAEGAREAARYSAIHYADAGYTNAVAQQKAIDAAPIASLKLADVTINSCAPGSDSVVTISAKVKYLTGLPTLVPFLPDIMNISAKGVMQCGG